MSKSYQSELPSSRVNITLDVETGGKPSKKELPMKLLVLGDFSHGQATGELADRNRVNVNKHNLHQVLNSLLPAIDLTVPNRIQPDAGDLSVHLAFRDFSDFKPEQIVEQVPELRRLMAMRNLLKDLKSCVIDNQSFRRALEAILKDANGAQALMNELTQQAPLVEGVS